MGDFEKWLCEKQSLKVRSARDVCSRLKRIKYILQTEDITEESLEELQQNFIFKTLSVSVKSQLKRAIRLYLKFISEE